MLEHILTACNENPDYLYYIPFFIKSWKHLFPDVTIVIVMIMNEIPEDLKEYAEHMVLFDPIEGMSSIYQAQNIRIYYPALLQSKACLITDIDLFPMSRGYYISGYTPKMLESTFVTFRPMKPGIVDDNQIALCYNIASSEVWRKVNGVNNIQDVCIKLIENYPINYGELMPPPLDWLRVGWFKDQELLFDFVKMSNIKHHIVGDGLFKRIDKSYHFTLDKASAIKVKDKYSDFIPPRKGFPDWKQVISTIVNKLILE